MRVDLKDKRGVQEYLDFLHGEIKTKDATIAEQGAEIASFIEDQKEEYNKTEDRFVDYEDEIAEQGAEIAELKREVAGLSLTLAEMEEAP